MENQIMGKMEWGNPGQQNSVTCLLKMVPSQETLIQTPTAPQDYQKFRFPRECLIMGLNASPASYQGWVLTDSPTFITQVRKEQLL